MANIIIELKRFAVLWRHLSSIAVVLVTIWTFSGPFVEAYAADALLEVLKKQGIDPQAISEMQKQGIENGKSINNLDQDADKIRGDLNAVKQQIGQVANQIQDQSAQADRVESLVRQLLEAQLRKTEAAP